MKPSIIITFLLSLPFIFLQAEDSHTAIMQYLQSARNREISAGTIQSVESLPVKSLLIHPSQREDILGKAQFSRPTITDEQIYVSSDGHFKFHYTTTGYNAVDTLSTNEDGVPDYVYEAALTAEYVYRILIDTLGFDPPPVDNYEGAETDIYILNFAGSAYAYTHPEDAVTTTSRTEDWTAYMEIDNDYAESSYTTSGLDGLRVTIAHEYFHVVQLGYNWYLNNGLTGSRNGDTYFLEWSSTWFEERAYPDVDDYVQYLGNFFYNPGRSLWDFYYAYAMGPFLYYLQKVYDQDVLPKTWEKIKSHYALQALMDVVAEYGGDLATQYNNYVNACYFTGTRYDETFAVAPDAASFPELSITTQPFSDPLTIDATVKPLATNPYSISFTASQYLKLNVESDAGGNFNGSYIIAKSMSADLQRNFDDQRQVFIGATGNDDHLIMFFTNTLIDSSLNLFLTIEATDTFSTKFLALYANPYSWKNQEPFNIRLQLGKFVNTMHLEIFNIIGQRVYNQSIDAEDFDPGIVDLRISSADLRNRNLSSGIYFLRLRAGDIDLVRKFTIIN